MRTALYERHQGLGAKIARFHQWELPIHYSGIIAEHLAVRNSVGLFDVSHMGRIDIEGGAAAQLSDYLSTNRLAEKPDGSATYTVVCNEAGKAIDDALVYQVRPDYFFFVANASNREKDLAHLTQEARQFGCRVVPRFNNIGILAVQGPHAREVLIHVFQQNIQPKAMHFVELLFQRQPVIVSRTGYTGSVGFELFVPTELLGQVWDAVMEAGEAYGILPCGLGARDTLRLEAGYALYGHELSEQIAPTESLSAWTVNWKKADFIGKEALIKLENSPYKRAQYGFRLLEEGVPREGFPLLKGAKKIGVVTSGSHSPCLHRGVLIGMVNGTLAFGETVDVEIRKRRVKAEVVKLPFVNS